METNAEIKEIVQQRYGQIARQSSGCGCGCGCGDNISYSVLSEDYAQVEGYVQAADLGLGCGLPTEHAGIITGDTVVDLGSGAGNDAFIARHLVGEQGKVIGVDMTPEMVTKAIENNAKLGYRNIEFRLGEIEELPVESDTVNVVLSNCVLNLVPDKEKAFAEIYRILKPGGHFCISDIVLNGELPVAIQKDAEMYVGCVAGAMQEADYLGIVRRTGFQEVEVKTRIASPIPDDILQTVMSAKEIEQFRAKPVGIFSITVVGKKL